MLLSQSPPWLLKLLYLLYCRNSISRHGAKISLICNETMAENEAIFEFINVTNIPTDTYVSMKWKHVDILMCTVSCSWYPSIL